MVVKKRVSSADIARMTGVSRATVSYIINNRPDQTVREETRLRVLEAIRKSGYRPNQNARALAGGTTRTIALWVPITNRSVSGHVIEQVLRRARSEEFHVVVVEIRDESPDSMLNAGLLDRATFCGVIAVDATSLVERSMDRCGDIPPIVTIGPAYSKRTDYVGVDLAGGTHSAMRHLLDCGRRRITFVAHEYHRYPGDARYDAYVAGMESVGAQPDVLPLLELGRRDAYDAVTERFRAGDRPDGLLCFNDDIAIGANKALHDLGVGVPTETSVIGSDGIDDTAYSIPSISTVAQPFTAMCRLAWEYLQRRLNDPTGSLIGTVLPMELVVRQSTI